MMNYIFKPIKHMRNNSKQRIIYQSPRGFIATIAVTMLAYSILAAILVTAQYVKSYVDNVYLFESRIEARKNIRECLSHAENLISRNYYLNGMFFIRCRICSTVNLLPSKPFMERTYEKRL